MKVYDLDDFLIGHEISLDSSLGRQCNSAWSLPAEYSEFYSLHYNRVCSEIGEYICRLIPDWDPIKVKTKLIL